jgi:predicted small secreted protein
MGRTFERFKPMTRKLIIALTAGLFALTATACNTVRGAGADLESAADAVDDET